jgi:tetratricopeptide (TPR) repeat protein
MIWKLNHLFSRKDSPAQPDAESWFQRGNSHVSQQQWLLALDCYREAVRGDPNHAHAHAYMGNVLRQLRRADEAIVAYDRAIAANPAYAEAHYNRGAILQQAKQARAALESYESALAINPAFVEAHCSRADVLQELGRLDEALSSYDTAITLNGGFARAYFRRGVLRQQLLQLEAAAADYKQASVLKPDYADAHAARGLVLMALGQAHAALAGFDTAIQLKPDLAPAFSGRGQAQAKLGLLVDARASHDQAILLAPHDAAIHFNRGCFLSDLKDWNNAVESYQAAIALKPEYADAYCNLGHAQQEAGRTDAALDSYERALKINPKLSIGFNNRGNLFRSTHRFDQAVQDYRQAIGLEPNSIEAHYNLALLSLLRGDFQTGWAEYEWRRLIEEARAVPVREFPQPAWSGNEPLRGKRIFLYAEQGLGDTIQFCRYVSLVAGLGAHVTLEVPAPLGDLLGNLDGVSQLVLAGAPIPPADYQCSLMSLPLAYKTTLETVPCQVPYLRADANKVARWHEILGPRTRPRVGLAWSGNPRHRDDHHRSINLAQWIHLLPDECEYFCVQKEIRDDDRRIMDSNGKVTPIDAHIDNFTDTAALLDALDLVISVDTSLAHLSGAMGKTTWILLPFLPDWRWLLERRDTPWYPTATLYRQPVAGDWHSVLTEVKKDLLSIHVNSEVV